MARSQPVELILSPIAPVSPSQQCDSVRVSKQQERRLRSMFQPSLLREPQWSTEQSYNCSGKNWDSFLTNGCHALQDVQLQAPSIKSCHSQSAYYTCSNFPDTTLFSMARRHVPSAQDPRNLQSGNLSCASLMLCFCSSSCQKLITSVVLFSSSTLSLRTNMHEPLRHLRACVVALQNIA